MAFVFLRKWKTWKELGFNSAQSSSNKAAGGVRGKFRSRASFAGGKGEGEGIRITRMRFDQTCRRALAFFYFGEGVV